MTATTANPFDSKAILDGIRRWVEIETPTEAPEQVNKLATMVADGYRDLPVTIERVAGHGGCGDHLRGALVMGPGRAGNPGAEPSRYRAPDGISSSACRSRSRATAPSAPASTT